MMKDINTQLEILKELLIKLHTIEVMGYGK